jgi:hypothetical protein
MARFFRATALAAGLALLTGVTALADVPYTLLPGTAVLLSQSSGGNGGNTSSTTSSTNIFSPAAYADYKRLGGEPTTTLDRYPLFTGTVRGKTCTATSPCYPDFAYVSSPNGFVFPHTSTFFKSSDLGETFRTTAHFEGTDFGQFTEGGGGDSHIAIGQKTHNVYFVDLPSDCVTVSVSSDFGETFASDSTGCGINPGAPDDRPWIAVDEVNHSPGNAYVSFINFTNGAAPTLALSLSTNDGLPGTYLGSPCNLGTDNVGAVPISGGTQAPNAQPTPCPDPSDSDLAVAGPPVVDLYNSKTKGFIYIPFIRATPVIPDVSSGPPFSLWVAASADGGNTWTRYEVANLGAHDPDNIFPELTVDNTGNLYYTWSQTQLPSETQPALGGEQDVYYTYSGPFTPPTTNQPGSFNWVPPIDLTGEANDSAVFPWMVAGDAGQVDLVFYKANTGLNSNVAEVDSSGNPCDSSTTTCAGPNPSVWNVYFAQSQNALNSGANFKAVQISSQPNHLGQVCTAGLGCTTGGNRDLLDFFTVNVDHLGAANITWADDHNGFSNTINRFSRQLSGNSIFKNQNINLQSSWPITDHAVSDVPGDVSDASGKSEGSCPGMDLTGTSEHEANGVLTISLSLVGAPTSTNAIACARANPVTGGLWGAEFWANSADGGHNFYVAYRDNPLDTPNPRVEDGMLDTTLNATLTSLEFNPVHAYPATPPPFSCASAALTTACTLTITVPISDFGIKDGAGLYSISGISAYWLGTGSLKPPLNYQPGNSEQADLATAFDDNGTGTTTK